MAKVTINLDVEMSYEVSANEFKEAIEMFSDRLAETLKNEVDGVVMAEVKKVRVVL